MQHKWCRYPSDRVIDPTGMALATGQTRCSGGNANRGSSLNRFLIAATMPVIRKVLPSEAGQYKAHLLRLNGNDRYARFTGTVSERVIEQHCDAMDWSRTLLIGAFDEEGVLRGAVELCTDRLLWPNEAELAVSVEPCMQGQGVGTSLMRRGLNIARNRAIRNIHLICLSDNFRMRALAQRLGGKLTMDGTEVSARIALTAPTQFSYALEALEDGANVFKSVLERFQSSWQDRRAA